MASSSSSSCHEVRPINDLFLPHDFIRLAVSLMVVQVVFPYVNIQGAVLGTSCLPSCNDDLTICLYCTNLFSTGTGSTHFFYVPVYCILLCVS
jgi:hypothetical protein